MNTSPIACYDKVTLRPLHESSALHDSDLIIQIVPSHEADADHGRVSADAPLGRATLHRRCGDIITIHVQRHSTSMRILAVQKRRSQSPILSSASIRT